MVLHVEVRNAQGALYVPSRLSVNFATVPKSVPVVSSWNSTEPVGFQ